MAASGKQAGSQREQTGRRVSKLLQLFRMRIDLRRKRGEPDKHGEKYENEDWQSQKSLEMKELQGGTGNKPAECYHRPLDFMIRKSVLGVKK